MYTTPLHENVNPTTRLGSLLHVFGEELAVKVGADCVIDEALFHLRLALSTVLEHDVVVPLLLERVAGVARVHEGVRGEDLLRADALLLLGLLPRQPLLLLGALLLDALQLPQQFLRVVVVRIIVRVRSGGTLPAAAAAVGLAVRAGPIVCVAVAALVVVVVLVQLGCAAVPR